MNVQAITLGTGAMATNLIPPRYRMAVSLIGVSAGFVWSVHANREALEREVDSVFQARSEAKNDEKVHASAQSTPPEDLKSWCERNIHPKFLKTPWIEELCENPELTPTKKDRWVLDILATISQSGPVPAQVDKIIGAGLYIYDLSSWFGSLLRLSGLR